MITHTRSAVGITANAPPPTEKDIEGACAAILDAFGYNNDPLETPSFLSGDNTFSPDLCRWQIRCGLAAGKVYVAETASQDIVGAAVWFGPEEEVLKSNPRDKQQAFYDRFLSVVKAKYPKLPHWWNSCFLPRLDEFAAEALGDATAQLDSWNLQLIGVANAYKGRRIGTELIQVVKAKALQQKVPRERRLTVMAGPVEFYRSIGFELVHQTEIDSEKSLGMKASFFYLTYDSDTTGALIDDTTAGLSA
ncbi:hypothetical protein BC835DRAFT_1412687 [Cytidiella melzeri]|nr:hypothetical protein BC835DRAFT_1412687 [Cytidiella melzeri]